MNRTDRAIAITEKACESPNTWLRELAQRNLFELVNAKTMREAREGCDSQDPRTEPGEDTARRNSNIGAGLFALVMITYVIPAAMGWVNK